MGDALAGIEFSSLAQGLRTLDTIAKRAPVRILHAGRHSGPKFVVLFDGDVASVEESFEEALADSRATVIDSFFLPYVHKTVVELLGGTIATPDAESALLLVELTRVASAVQAIDTISKLIPSQVVDAQFAAGISGRAYFAMQGELSDIEYARDEILAILDDATIVAIEVVSRPHPEMFIALGQKTPFKEDG